MQKPIITVILLIIGLFAITKFQDFIKNNTPENISNTSVIVQPRDYSDIDESIDINKVEDLNNELGDSVSTTTDSFATSSMKMH